MADITYSKPTWDNDTTPALSESNMQAISDAIDAVAHKANRGAALLRSDCVNEDTDGNTGQPPAPKPTTGTPAGGANGVGKLISGQVTAGNTLYYSGGSNLTGQWQIFYVDITAGTVTRLYGNIGNGAIGVVGAGNAVDYVTIRIS